MTNQRIKRVTFALLLALGLLVSMGLGPCRGDDPTGCPPGQHGLYDPKSNGTVCVDNQ